MRNGQSTAIAAGSELARPFLPARNFDASKRFYETLGFTKLLDAPEVAIFAIGSGGFLLQNHYVDGWAKSFMMQLMVDNLDRWWTHIQALDLTATFAVPAPKEPAAQPWGLKIAYVTDPSGVLWHVAQRRKGIEYD